MRYLSSADVAEAREALLIEMPTLQIRSFIQTEQGWDNHTFVLNEEWIVRFQKDDEFQAKQERWVLGSLRGRVPVPIPLIEWMGTSLALTGYRMLPGVQLSKAWASFPIEARARLIDRVVEFCAAMHSALDVEEAKANGLEHNSAHYGHVRKWSSPQDPWHEEARRALTRLDSASAPMRVVHNDIHGENILVDPETCEVTGIIDFGDVAFGDPCLDLEYLCEFDLGAAERIAELYESRTGLAVDPQRIRDHYFLHTVDDFLAPEMPEVELPQFREMIDEYLAFRQLER